MFLQCHTGILGGGHYVAYAKNPNGKWYCYNDSSCKVGICDVIKVNVQSTHTENPNKISELLNQHF